MLRLVKKVIRQLETLDYLDDLLFLEATRNVLMVVLELHDVLDGAHAGLRRLQSGLDMREVELLKLKVLIAEQAVLAQELDHPLLLI